MVKVGGFSGGGGTEITNATLTELFAKEGYEIDENMLASLEFDPIEQEVSTTTGSYENNDGQVMIKLTENLALQIFSYYNSYEIHARFLTITEAGIIFGSIITIATSNVLIGESILEPVKIDANRYLLIFSGAPSRNNDLSWKLYGVIININTASKSITHGAVKSITQNASGRFYRESESLSKIQTAYARKVSENTVFVITHVSTGNSSSNFLNLSYPLGVWVTINNMDLTLSAVQLLSNNGSGYTKRVKFISDTKFVLVFRLVSSTYQGTIYASIGTLDPVNKTVSMSTPVLLSSNNGGYSIWLALSDEGNRFIVVANKYNGSSASSNMYWYVSVTINDDDTLTIENVEDLFSGVGSELSSFSEKINGVYYAISNLKFVCALKMSPDFKSLFAQGEYSLVNDIRSDIIKTPFGIAGIWYKSDKKGLHLIVSVPSKLQSVSLDLTGTGLSCGLLMMNEKYLIASTDIGETNNAITLFKLNESGLKAVPLKGLADIVTAEVITPTVSGKAYLL